MDVRKSAVLIYYLAPGSQSRKKVGRKLKAGEEEALGGPEKGQG